MAARFRHGRRILSRRDFILGAGCGVVAGVNLAWLGSREWRNRLSLFGQASSFSGKSVEDKNPKFAMPGPFPGRVIEVDHRESVRPDYTIDRKAVRTMMERGMCALTGADHPVEAWKYFFEPGDVVGIKVNPVGMSPGQGIIGAISRPEVLLETVRGLRSAGVPSKNIILFERYAVEFRGAGYEDLLRERELDGVRWYASAVNGGPLQVDIEGYDGGKDRDPHVVGYDPDVFVHMGFACPEHDSKDDRRFRSHLSVIVTRLVNKIVTIPVLKDHRSAGVTAALKNLSHGMNNNVWRSHLSGIYRGNGFQSGPNQCNTFIPTAVGQMPLREKATLHILDGLVGVYEGGPGAWNATWATWPRKSLFFATDPVAMDHVAWDIIDAKRAQEGWLPVARMGLMQNSNLTMLSARLAALAGRDDMNAAILDRAGSTWQAGRSTEVFDRRQPEHIILASMIGLGTFKARAIEHRQIRLA